MATEVTAAGGAFASTNAVVAIWDVAVPWAAVGALGTPVNAGESSGANDPMSSSAASTASSRSAWSRCHALNVSIAWNAIVTPATEPAAKLWS